MRKMGKEKAFTFFVISVILVSLIILSIFIVRYFNKANPPIKVNIVDKLDDYGYVLKEDASIYYKELFSELKKVLNEDDIDENKYMNVLVKLFIADFYTLNNKLTSSDIGGVDYVYSDYKESFQKLAKESVYKVVKSNIYGDRNQDLPIVKNVEIIDTSEKVFEYLEKDDDKAYYVEVTIDYEKDLGYSKKHKLVVIHNDKKLEVAKME